MAEELSEALKIGRLEDKFQFYEPLFISLQGIVSIPGEITKIQDDLQVLKESRVAVGERITTLFKAQDRVYKDMVKSFEEQTRLLEKEVAECPIQEVAAKLVVVDKKVARISPLEDQMETMEKILDSFKLKGWDLIFRITPWVLAFVAATYAAVNN